MFFFFVLFCEEWGRGLTSTMVGSREESAVASPRKSLASFDDTDLRSWNTDRGREGEVVKYFFRLSGFIFFGEGVSEADLRILGWGTDRSDSSAVVGEDAAGTPGEVGPSGGARESCCVSQLMNRLFRFSSFPSWSGWSSLTWSRFGDFKKASKGFRASSFPDPSLACCRRSLIPPERRYSREA